MLFSNYTSSEHFLSTLLLVNRHFKTSQVSRPPVVNQPVLDSSGSPHLRNIMTFQRKVQTLHKAHKFVSLFTHQAFAQVPRPCASQAVISELHFYHQILLKLQGRGPLTYMYFINILPAHCRSLPPAWFEEQLGFQTLQQWQSPHPSWPARSAGGAGSSGSP